MSGIPVGVDLGTTYSAIAVAQKHAEAGRTVLVDLLPVKGNLGSEKNPGLLPSCVAENLKGDLVVGRPAQGFKRMGRAAATSAKSLIGTDGKPWELQGKAWGPIEVSAEILRVLRESAESYLQKPVTNAVIAVPASFDSDRRLATLKAAKEAGFLVQDESGEYLLDALIEEPTAALIQFINREAQRTTTRRLSMPSTVCIVDIGGGTTDVCIARVLPQEGGQGLFELEHLGVSPHTLIGGDNFDLEVLGYLQKDFEEYMEQPLSQLRSEDRRKVTRELEYWAEQVKVSLGITGDMDEKFPIDAYVGGTDYAILTELSKSDYDHIVEQLLGWDITDGTPAKSPDAAPTSILDPVLWALDLAKLKPQAIDHVLLTGGMAQLWCIGKRLEDLFGRKPLLVDDPDEAVAKGAAIDHFYRTVPQDERPRGLGRGKLPEDLSIGIEVQGHPKRVTIAPRGTAFPTPETPDTWHTSDVRIGVTAPEGMLAKYNDLFFFSGKRKLSHVRFRFSEPLRGGSPAVLQYRIDHGVVRYRLEVTNSRNGDKQEIEGLSSLVRDEAEPPSLPGSGTVPPRPPVKITDYIDKMRRGRTEAEVRSAGEAIARAPNNNDAVEQLIAGTENANVVYRKWCVITLGHIGETNQGREAARKGVSALVAALRAPRDWDQLRLPQGFSDMTVGQFVIATQVEAGYALGRIADTRAIKPLYNTMEWSGGRAGIRLAAMQALGKIGNDISFVARAVEYLREGASQFRIQAAWSIGRACSQSRPDTLPPQSYVPLVLDQLLSVLADPDAPLHARINAVYALGAAGARRKANDGSPYGDRLGKVRTALDTASQQPRNPGDAQYQNVITISRKLIDGEALTQNELLLFRKLEDIREDAGTDPATAQTRTADRFRWYGPDDPPLPAHLNVIITRETGVSMLTESVVLTGYAPDVGRVGAVTDSLLSDLIDKADELVQLANSRGDMRGQGVGAAGVTSNVEKRLRSLGTLVHDYLLHTKIQRRLGGAPDGSFLTLSLAADAGLLEIPWELAWDGNAYLSSRFAMGRQLEDPQDAMAPLADEDASMLIIVDPTGKLDSAQVEADVIRSKIPDWVSTKIVGAGDIRTQVDVLEQLSEKRYDLVHFAGHSVFSGTDPNGTGWVLAFDGNGNPVRIMPAALFSRLRPELRPKLVFSNSCSAAVTFATDQHKAYNYDVHSVSIGSAFLKSGVPAYIGTLFTVRDQVAARFAGHFYERIFERTQSGGTTQLGEAMRLARESISRSEGPAEITWASYVLYGNPSALLLAPRSPNT